MNKSKIWLILFTLLITLNSLLVLFLNSTKGLSDKGIEIRHSFVSLSGLPDISVYNESPSERHRNLTDTASIFNSDPFAPDTDFSSIIYKKRAK